MTGLDRVSLLFAFLCVGAYASGDLHLFDLANAVLGPVIALSSYRRRAWAAFVLNVTFTVVGIVGLLAH